jgi:predicted aminopeptidase
MPDRLISTRRIGGLIVARLMLLSIILSVLTACSTVSYYEQAVRGHLGLVLKSTSIDRLIATDQVGSRTRERLMWVREIRRFAVNQLGLPDNGSYTRYADLGRDYAVWAVFASEEFSVEPKTWCFPIAGCVPYRGYFSRHRAERFARDLKVSGLDVFSGGVPAYSTLGWGADPVLNTVLMWPDARLAGLIFHELAHQVVYVKNESAFNESFATFVEEVGVQQWLRDSGDTQALAAYRSRRAWRARVVKQIFNHRASLVRLYRSGLSADVMRKKKEQLFAHLRERYRNERFEGQHPRIWDHWVLGKPNNARLNAITAYHQYIPAFQQLFEGNGSNLSVFFEKVRALTEVTPTDRIRQLSMLGSLPPHGLD